MCGRCVGRGRWLSVLVFTNDPLGTNVLRSPGPNTAPWKSGSPSPGVPAPSLGPLSLWWCLFQVAAVGARQDPAKGPPFGATNSLAAAGQL